MARTGRVAYLHMSEEELEDNVFQLCRLLRLRVVHFRPARVKSKRKTGDNGEEKDTWRTPVKGDGNGWPDLHITGRTVLYRELKSADGTVSADQQAWIEALRAAGQDADVWRPKDWHSGRIHRELSACAGRIIR